MKTITTLTEYGLTERQARVYLACLELGVATIQEISRKVLIARSSCEATLGQLHKRGFVSFYKHKTVRKYSPEDPRNVAKIANKKVEALTEALPNLVDLFLNNKTIPSVRMYEGKTGMNTILEEILSEAKILQGFGSADDLFNLFGETFIQFRKRRIQNKIPLKIILKDTEEARQRQLLGQQELREVKLISQASDFSSLIFMWGSKIASFSLRDEMIAVVVESKEITAGQKIMFNFIWNTLPEYKK